MDKGQTLPDYFREWMELYKKDAVAKVTYAKYMAASCHLDRIVPNLCISEITRADYQRLLNIYAESHAHQTVLDFHHQIKGALMDAYEEGLLAINPTRKIVIKGINKSHRHKPKFLNQDELQRLIQAMNLTGTISWDYLLLLIAKTGLRFAEALGLTPSDFDFRRNNISVSKTWNYKTEEGGFAPTKNESSIRIIRIDHTLAKTFHNLMQDSPRNAAFFTSGRRVHNATVNNRLRQLCAEADVPVISIHGLRHTHASLLLYAGVSTASVSKRLGHSSIATTQNVYLHIIRELESRDDAITLQVLEKLQR